MTRVFNFSAGPAALPEPVLRQAAEEMLDWHGAGCGVMEMSHRGKEFTSIIEQAEADLRELMAIPRNYRVLFLQGGATQQFAQIPMNLLGGGSADYLVTGTWSQKAHKEAQRLAGALGGKVRLVGSTESCGFTRALRADELALDPDAAYVHLCTNETIHGVEVGDDDLPRSAAPLVGDMSSHILSRPTDVSRYGLIYAGAQKNIGPSGLVIVIVREDLLGRASPLTPTVMDYKVMADNGSMLNTPPTYSIYVAGLVFQWLKVQGGLAAMERRNVEKAALLYDFIDGSGFYRNMVEVRSRSRMNIPFLLPDDALNDAFLAGAKAAGLTQLKGHKSVGGMRASIYNAMPVEGVRALVEYMRGFAAQHG
ncbi:3-phosphoserine/phosphohydroxythreonine transaminase [Aromatoleum evansii]|uniref:Phosphoserine aminotransferase n=1 Tax=Aromatoleum evansii TaxID=59406 RepID=A0ABZ1AHZ6_AROEV|nr:3-phosphoserine/phosphohydroxythreonine transaminase [Aromatoleum evansii]NMG28241.1 3-phosphoserine/phosphohydroxythreonine transaminase [Aromatoleum evansii]WRL45497.1 3-phosphoserine/phosphohydroxythreonine transaminase [Aromatoleum evansii]